MLASVVTAVLAVSAVSGVTYQVATLARLAVRPGPRRAATRYLLPFVLVFTPAAIAGCSHAGAARPVTEYTGP